MKLSKLFLLGLLFTLFISSTKMFAQDEEGLSYQQNLGLGFSLRGTPLVSGDLLLGGHIFFTVTPNIHIGSQVGFVYDGGTDILAAATYLVFAPYMKYYFDRIKSLTPFAIVLFNVSSVPERRFNQITGKEEVKTATNTSLQIQLGGQWYPTKSKNIAIFGGMQFFQYNIDPSRIVIGLGNPFLGVEWILD